MKLNIIDPTINQSVIQRPNSGSLYGWKGGNSLVKARAKPTQSEAIYTEQEPALE
jgi:hypothetical protein